jgi:putative Holliday junction resolvase
MKMIGLDVGKSKVGIATCDMLEVLASPYDTYKRRTPYLDARVMVELAEKLGAEKFVVGLPLKLDGSEGDSAQMAREFAENLAKHTTLPIVFQDERLSTVSALRIMQQNNTKQKNNKGYDDKVAAAIILQNYLEKFHKS